MVYMLKVDVMFAILVFGAAGVLILGLFAWNEAKRYARYLQMMAQVHASSRREAVAISRTPSRNHNTSSFRTV